MNKKQKQTRWTEPETQRLRDLWPTQSLRELAGSLGRSRDSVRERAKRLGLPSKEVQGAPVEPLADFWKREATDAKRKLAEAVRERTATDLLVERAVELAPKTYRPVSGKVFTQRKAKGSSPQSALLVFSDCHIGQIIHPDQTLGMGHYNFDLFLRRLQRLEKSVFSILEDHVTTKIPEIVVAMIGDLIHGNLTHSAEAAQVNLLFNQFFSAGHAIAQFLRNISAIAPLRIHTAVGNHPRWGTQKRMPTENRYSNLDMFIYTYLAALLRDVPRITFVLNKQPFALFEVQGFHFYAGHGDHLRGGDRMLGVPNHAIGRNLSNTSQLFSSAGLPLPNYYLYGHFHRPITLPHSSGEIIINGGWPGLDGFALMEAFNSSLPSQKFFLVHPKIGKAASYDLRLDLGDSTPHAYDLPGEFQCQ